MNDRAAGPAEPATNQPPLLVGYYAWERDSILRAAVARDGGGWIGEKAHKRGALVGSERMQRLAEQANQHPPQLRTHDRFGARIDAVDYHLAYDELMARHAGPAAADALVRSRVQGDWGRAFGTRPRGDRCDGII